MRMITLKLFVFLLACCLSVALTTPVKAPPARGRDCASCHDEVSGRSTITGYDTMTDLGTQLDGQTHGSLKTFTVQAGEVATFTFDITNGYRYAAPTVEGLERGGQQISQGNHLGYTSLTAWKTFGPPVYYSQVFSNVTQTVKTFSLRVREDTPGDYYLVDLLVGGLDSGWLWLESEKVYLHVIPQPVASRLVFYNNSSFDDHDAAANGNDDLAIAADKVALLPGRTATFANYTSYDQGINGIIIDIRNLPGTVTADDFQFMVGNSNDTNSWAAAPAPLTITVRPGDGVDGSDRVTIIWADGAIAKKWLEVTVKANVVTGLVLPDVFYFGNAIGDTGDSAGDTYVNATDEINARNNLRTFARPATVDDVHDFNRDGKVDATDQIIARNNPTDFTTGLKLITVP